MADNTQIMQQLYDELADTMQACDFAPVFPEGVGKKELPAVSASGRTVIDYRSEQEGKQNIALRLEQYDDKVALLCAQKEGELTQGDFAQLTLCLLDPKTADIKDIRFVAAECRESVEERFGKHAKKDISTVKLPQPVSKAAAKSGSAFYDANTLASRLSVLYPELREPYRENVATYGDFMPEDFFVHHGNAPIMATIRQNNPQKMKKLFNLLNEIYEDGTNETQSLIGVTILGQIDNDQELLANCLDYMSEDMVSPVIQVNKLLGSSSGKSIKMRMENPPQYKPKKKKGRKTMMSRLGM